ncbi:hypothetical protein B0H12DRAFT_1082364 [Mycena haematopus]|nr:hypothetical protein B0H12DRAFT_1082364 [Mycena haematopus]
MRHSEDSSNDLYPKYDEKLSGIDRRTLFSGEVQVRAFLEPEPELRVQFSPVRVRTDFSNRTLGTLCLKWNDVPAASAKFNTEHRLQPNTPVHTGTRGYSEKSEADPYPYPERPRCGRLRNQAVDVHSNCNFNTNELRVGPSAEGSLLWPLCSGREKRERCVVGLSVHTHAACGWPSALYASRDPSVHTHARKHDAPADITTGMAERRALTGTGWGNLLHDPRPRFGHSRVSTVVHSACCWRATRDAGLLDLHAVDVARLTEEGLRGEEVAGSRCEREEDVDEGLVSAPHVRLGRMSTGDGNGSVECRTPQRKP